VGCGGSGPADGKFAAFYPGQPPAEYQRGGVLYASYCASCHGALGKGQGLGPPLLDTLFFASRVSDSAMAQAVLGGSPQRYWNFGAMPAVERIDTAEVPGVVAYVRWLQAEFHGPAGATSTGTP
jgi:mono/diheme cytochrome c family protein